MDDQSRRIIWGGSLQGATLFCDIFSRFALSQIIFYNIHIHKPIAEEGDAICL